MNNTDMRQTVVVTPSGETYTGSTRLIREYHLTIDINGEECIMISCTAVMLQELVAGRLLTEGYIHCKDDIISIKISEEAARAHVQIISKESDSSDSIEAKRSEEDSIKTPDSERMFSLIREFAAGSLLHQGTSGTHSVLLECDGKIVCTAEDINRHNALDKAIGAMLLQELPPEECLLFTSGRIAEQTVQKIVAAGAKALVSKAVPTTQAVMLANEKGITLIGKAWPDSYEVF